MNDSPAVNDPVRSVSQPTAYGPTNPPAVPIELMNARPPASAMPVRNRIGIVKKMPRAALIPASDTVSQPNDTQKFVETTAQASPMAPTRHDSARFVTLLPPRSTCPAQRIIETDATAY